MQICICCIKGNLHSVAAVFIAGDSLRGDGPAKSPLPREPPDEKREAERRRVREATAQ